VKKTYPEVLADLAAQVATRLIDRGIPEATAIEVGGELADHFTEYWGGLQIYIPKNLRYQITQRDQEIFEEFDGSNMEAICRKHGITVRSFYRVINSVRTNRKKGKPRQERPRRRGPG